MKKLIALGAALAFGLGTLGFATSADARTRVIVAPVCYPDGWCPPNVRGWWTKNPWKPFNEKRYVACTKEVLPKRTISPALVFLVDACYLGDSW